MSDLNQEQKEYWGDASDYIYTLYSTKPAAKYLLGQMLDSVVRLTGMNSKSEILEIGCAAGTQSIALAAQGYGHVTGIDLSPLAIENAQRNADRRGVTPRFFTCDAVDMSIFGDETFDVIFSAGVMEHIPDLDRALREQHRVLKKGGFIYIQVPNTWCPWYWTGKRLRSLFSSKQHFKMPPVFRTFTTAEIAQRLAQTGFSRMRSEVMGAVVPQCPDRFLPANILLEKTLSRIPLLRELQALACVAGMKQ